MRPEPSSKAVLLVSHKEEMKLKAIQITEEVLIDADGLSKEKDTLKENELSSTTPLTRNCTMIQNVRGMRKYQSLMKAVPKGM